MQKHQLVLFEFAKLFIFHAKFSVRTNYSEL